MASEISELMHRNLFQVFGERNPGRREAVIAEIYSEKVGFSDPEGTVTGRAALAGKVKQLLDSAPGFTFQPDGEVRESANLGLLSWRFGPEGGPPATTGTDVALIEGGLITRLYTLLD